MIARKVEDLVVYRLSCELRNLVIATTATGRLSNDWSLRDQFRDAAASVAANVAEGFGRYRPREFAKALRYANGSLNELRAHTSDAVSRGYIDEGRAKAITRLCNRTGAALGRLLRYLESCDATPARPARTQRTP